MNNLLRGAFLTLKELNAIGFKKVGNNVLIDKTVLIPNPRRVCIGNNVRIDNGVLLSTSSGEIIIGNNVHIAPQCLIYSSTTHKVVFKNHTGLAAGCKLYGKMENYDGEHLMNPTHNNDDLDIISGDIILEKYATLGCDTVLFPGSVIPVGTVLGAKSLYTGKIPLKEWSIYVGSPVTFLKKRHTECIGLSMKYNTAD